MSQKASRKGVANDEKEKTDTPVKEMKKKMAANAEKEKQTTDKKDAEKPAEKSTDKNEKAAEKAESKVDKKTEKATEKNAEKKTEAPVEKKEESSSSKDDKNAKTEKPDPKKADQKPKQYGKSNMNGTTNGVENGTVSAADDDDDDDVMVIDEDEMFPELTYDDTSDPEFEPPGQEASRSFTRRSQAKATRTPETPRPASDKQAENNTDDSKVLKLKEDAPPSTDRKLRSSDSPKPQEKKDKPQETKKDLESPKKDVGKESETKDQEEKENGEKTEKGDVVIDIDASEEEPRKTDTNFSKSRVKVSPYRRSMRIADQTTSSVMANYTGNNTTMEMDISDTTASFISEDPSLDDSSYLSGLRAIRGRRSYKPLKEMTLRHVVNKSQTRSINVSASEQPSRPTAPVVGRKRKPDADDSAVGVAAEASEDSQHGKRMRLLQRLTHSLRRHNPLPTHRTAEIVGINSDLPLSAPVAQPPATFDPEALKHEAVPLAPAPAAEGDKDGKRCVVM